MNDATRSKTRKVLVLHGHLPVASAIDALENC
jgi:hypothetical protein